MSECANPLLLQWVGEWLEEAKTRNSKIVRTYKTAYESLRANPIPFAHPSEAKQLTGFGDKLCAKLTSKMESFCRESNLPPPQPRSFLSQSKRDDAGSSGTSVLTANRSSQSPPKKPRKPSKLKHYVPQYRSGGYGLILALSTVYQDPPTYITKQDAINLAQQHCDSSYTAPSDPRKLHTAWNSMRTLIEKQLVHERRGVVRKYALTDSGWACAQSIQKYMDSSTNGTAEDSTQVSITGSKSTKPTHTNQVPDIIPNGKEVNSESDLPIFTPIILEPGSFSVEMILDSREVRSKHDRDYIENELSRRGVMPIKRVMALGDVAWIAKVHDPMQLSNVGIEGDEIILDYIVERKRIDDLISSIKDKRFHEQKFRLGRSGIKNVIYLIEEISMMPEAYQNMEESVQSAIASTQVVNGYFVKITKKLDESIEYLASMNKILKEKYETNSLHLIPSSALTTTNYLPLLAQRRMVEPGIDYHITYPAFECLMSKSETLLLRDLYLKMLMCIKGVTGEKALEIQKRWKTPYELAQAYRKIEEEGVSSEQKREMKKKFMSNEMKNLIGRKKIGSSLSATINEVWGES